MRGETLLERTRRLLGGDLSKVSRLTFLKAVKLALFRRIPYHREDMKQPNGWNRLSAPCAKTIPGETAAVHGDRRSDEYSWLRNAGDPEVLAHIAAENAYTKKAIEPLAALRQSIYKEIVGRIAETDQTAPLIKDGYYYYSRTVRGRQYSIHARRRGGMHGAEQILLDENEEAKGHPYFALAAFSISKDHNLFAYATDVKGRERYDIRFKDLRTGKVRRDRIADTAGFMEWASDNKTLFYVRYDETQRPFQVWRHELGRPVKEDKLVFEEKDQRFPVQLTETFDREYIVIDSSSLSSSETWVLPSAQPAGEFRLLRAREKDVEYNVDHRDGWFYFRINDKGHNFRLMRTDGKTEEELIRYSAKVALDDFLPFQKHLVAVQRVDGLTRIRIREEATGKEHFVEFPEPCYDAYLGANVEWQGTVLRFGYTSLTTPSTAYDYDMDTHERKLVKQSKVRGGFQTSDYECERIFATSHDGARVPISLVYHKGFKRDGKAPLLLNGYGAYGFANDPHFGHERLSLLDRGFVYAIAHVRGGGDLGRPWYQAGKLQKKRNSFEDFVACAAHLVEQKYSNPRKMACIGGSAGGLLLGASLNLRPDLFEAAILHVPFVDCLNSMLDPSLPLTVEEYEEWGNPAGKKVYEYMKSYTPYENVREAHYPHLFVTGGLHDPRVGFWEPLKWISRIRDRRTDDNIALVKMNTDAGHAGDSGRYSHIREIALDWAFLITLLSPGKRHR